ncbi:winged helix-turn-helix transcriptional regulator [Microbulbifer sp. EKSA005]|uniref:winged helix-turn-helix transcriptional regulator n=1 Tax=Microbulbifer sp. EKSA005 TaxID=3243364 RepID=UPI004041BFDD
MREKKSAVQCAIEEALSVIGDRWSLLIIRDVLRGVNRFDTLQESLQISRNILTRRLNSLEEAGVLVKAPVSPGARRMLYNATPKCIALAPTLVSLIEWGTHWSEKPNTRWARVIDKRTGTPVTVDLVGKDGEPVSLLDLDLEY